MPKVDTLVLDARTRPALVSIRELGRAGAGVCAVDTEADAPGFVSRWSRASAHVPDFAVDPDAYVDALLSLCATHSPRSLLTAHDGTIEALRARRAELEAVVGVALAPEEALAVAVDKTATLTVAATLGMRAPIGVRARDGGDASEVPLPLVVKPVRSWVDDDGVGRRLQASVSTTYEDAARRIAAMLGAGGEPLVQEWLSGAREAVSLFLAEGRIWARFAQRADRTTPPLGGNSVARVSIPLADDLAEPAERLVRELGLDGYSEVEFRRDARGEPVLMEINPRLSASVEVAVRSGVSFPRLLHAWAAGEPLFEVGGYAVGQRMRWLGGDLEWLEHAMQRPGEPDVPSRGRALGVFFGDFARRTGYDYVDWHDMRPAVRAVRGAGHAYRGRARAKVRSSGSGSADTEVAIVGAGPYAISLSAHLSARGIRHEVFGKLMAGWRDHMPAGMFLKSEGFSSNICDPAGRDTLEHYCAEAGIPWAKIALPISLDTFVGYGEWFAQRNAPRVDSRLVADISPGFELTLSDGERLRARKVVVATGLQGFARTPAELAELPPSMLVHAYDLVDVASYPGKDLVLLGSGQSALGTAALLRENDCRAQVIARAPELFWAEKPRGKNRKLRWRMVDPLSKLGEGWQLLAYSELPAAYHHLPVDKRVGLGYSALGPCGAWWLRDRYEGVVPTHLSHNLLSAQADGSRAVLRFETPDGEKEYSADVVCAATGYDCDVTSLDFLDPALAASISTLHGKPLLDRGFQSSVAGLHFAGYTAAGSFGPLMRFACGTEFAAPRLSRALARK
jgi:cation diffusion facilitator CzcD-associated flavoprotein CzcO/predicted ATP-grasp superfamily ATP-dependent carboligase